MNLYDSCLVDLFTVLDFFSSLIFGCFRALTTLGWSHCIINRIIPVIKTKLFCHLFFFITIFWLCWVLVAACGIKFHDQGLNPGPLRWECGVLATGQPRESLFVFFKSHPPYSFTKMSALSLQCLSNLLLS